VLEVAPIAGRDFVPADVGSPERIVLLTDEQWRRRFNRSPDVFTRDLFGSQGTRQIPYRVVGVLPRGFLVPSSSRADRLDGLVLTSLPYDADVTEGSFRRLGPSAVARLAPGITREQAQAEVDVIVTRLKADFPDPVLAGIDVHLLPVRQGLFQFYRSYAWLIVWGVALVLLIACVNLAALLLAKGRGREHDIAVRVAIGASPWRVVRLVLIESVLLCGVSAAVALVGARVIFAGVLSLVPAGLRGVAVDPFDPRLIGIALAATAGSGVLAALLPAVRARRVDVLVGLRQDGRDAGGRLRGSATLMAIESALGVLLVTGAATTVASFAGMAYGFPGFDEQGLYGVRVNHGYVRAEGRIRYAPDRIRLALETIRSAPGIDRAGAVSTLTVGMERRTGDAFWQARGMEGHRLGVSDGYFDALGTLFLAGRDISASEVDGQERVALVSRSGAAQLCPGGSASDCVGRRIDHEGRPLTIVGVVEDITSAPGEAPTAGLYLPMTLEDAPATQSAVQVAVRVPAGAVPDPATIDARLDAAFGPGGASVFSIAERTAPYLQRPRFQAVLFASLAAIAIVLAAIGLYAVAAFDVARRRREMGVRLALGATPGDLRRTVIGTAVRPVLIGAAGGLTTALWAAQFLQSFLVDVDARDPWTYALVALVLVATAVVAAWLPARRAAKTDPAQVLRAV
jgi:predicted permease